MSPGPWQLLGRLLQDYAQGRREAVALLVQEDGECLPLSAAVFFRPPREFTEAEVMALDLSRGKVLDVGAGAGCHTLALQEREIEVCALDVSPQAVEVMRRRGVAEARVGDVFDETLGGSFDTLLLLMNGMGVVGDLAGLDRFLARIPRLLAEEGQVLVDSCDLRSSDDPNEEERMAARVRQGRYRGETLQWLVYGDRRSLPMAWLYLDAATLELHARRHGWRCQVIFQGDDGTYLARLTRRQ